MGREGFEPSTLGLRVEDGALADIRKAWRSRIVKPNVLARVGASSRRLVDFVLTPEREAWGDLNAAALSREHTRSPTEPRSGRDSPQPSGVTGYFHHRER